MFDNNCCFHCGLEINAKENYSLLINNEVKFMCCKGCLAVAKFIIDNNFYDYYTYRVGFNKTVDSYFYNENIIYDDVLYQEKFLKKKRKF